MYPVRSQYEIDSPIHVLRRKRAKVHPSRLSWLFFSRYHPKAGEDVEKVLGNQGCVAYSFSVSANIRRSSEASSAAAHNLSLAYKLGTELGAIQRKVDVEVDAVEGALRSIHSLEILLEVLS